LSRLGSGVGSARGAATRLRVDERQMSTPPERSAQAWLGGAGPDEAGGALRAVHDGFRSGRELTPGRLPGRGIRAVEAGFTGPFDAARCRRTSAKAAGRPGDARAAGRRLRAPGTAAVIATVRGPRRGFREVVVRCRDAGLRDPLPEVLVGLAVTAAREGDAERAGCLQGAAVALAGQLPRQPAPVQYGLRAQVNEIGERRCGTEPWGRAVARRAALELDEMLTLALGDSAGDG
jgi:hypothetical protein